MDQQQQEEFYRLYCLAVGIARNAGDTRPVQDIVTEVMNSLGVVEGP